MTGLGEEGGQEGGPTKGQTEEEEEPLGRACPPGWRGPLSLKGPIKDTAQGTLSRCPLYE